MKDCKVCCEKVTQEADRALANGHACRMSALRKRHHGVINTILGSKLSGSTRAFINAVAGALKAPSLGARLSEAVSGTLNLDDPKVELLLNNMGKDGDALRNALEEVQETFEDLQADLRALHNQCLGCCEKGNYELPSCERSWDWIMSKADRDLEVHPGGVDERWEGNDKSHPPGLLKEEVEQ